MQQVRLVVQWAEENATWCALFSYEWCFVI